MEHRIINLQDARRQRGLTVATRKDAFWPMLRDTAILSAFRDSERYYRASGRASGIANSPERDSPFTLLYFDGRHYLDNHRMALIFSYNWRTTLRFTVCVEKIDNGIRFQSELMRRFIRLPQCSDADVTIRHVLSDGIRLCYDVEAHGTRHEMHWENLGRAPLQS